ncbi:MAG: hypothetical protein Kow00121_58100 [Elainellaceae cyanobacterium]
MVDASLPIPTAYHLEWCIKTVLELGELAPGMEANIQEWLNRNSLSDHEQKLLGILQDVLADGTIDRITY